MIKPNLATYSEFARCVNDTFRLHVAPDEVWDVILSSASRYTPEDAEGAAARYESFSLLFHTRLSWHHTQRVFRLTHPVLGEMDLFLVPLGPDKNGMRLEAVFNQLI